MYRFLLWVVVIVHFYVVLANVIAFVVLPFSFAYFDMPFWLFALLITPIESIIITLIFARFQCPMTRLENYFRRKLKMNEISGFIGYYILRK